MRKILYPQFFNRSGIAVARDLLGKYLVRRYSLIRANGGIRKNKKGEKGAALMINEVELYEGFKDKASHASRGETKRNFPMFGPPGYVYVYFTYGMHWMLNIVIGKEGYPAAVLIRGAGDPASGGSSYNGPAKLTKALKIDKSLNNKPLSKKTRLWIEDRGVKISKKDISRAPRVGISYAGKWAKKPYRFLLGKRPSKKKRRVMRRRS